MSTLQRRDQTTGRRDVAVRGTIRRRLLVNALVDPEEAARWLPIGLEPHVGEEGVVVGCCLLQIEHLRPLPLAPVFGVQVMAAAHRISVDLPDSTGVGVFVPMRHTSSRLAAVAGGRLFPGVHRIAEVRVEEHGNELDWIVAPSGNSAVDANFAMRVVVTDSEVYPGAAVLDEVGDTCLGATVGLSPDRGGQLEAATMTIDQMRVRRVDVVHLESSFLAGFESARPAASYLMQDVGVTWSSGAVAASGSATGWKDAA